MVPAAIAADTAPIKELFSWLSLELFAGLFLFVLAVLISKMGFRLRPLPGQFSISRTKAILLCAVVPVAIRLLLLPLQPPPVPQAHDEFSYLLAAQTFTTGHLSNASPPFPEHFETFHENMSPTYHSIYPPAQGAWLAAGILLFGQPWAGVCLSIAALCGSICWALLGCFPRKYAFLAGMIVALRIGVHSYWIDTFFGGAVAAVGGALLLGAAVRSMKKPTAGNAILLFIGLAILATSRPYEGLAFAVPMVAVFLFHSLGRKDQRKERVQALGLLFVCSLLLGSFLAFYNYRCTGSVLLHPHQLNEERHQVGSFVWAHGNPSSHHSNDRMDTFYLDEDRTSQGQINSFRSLARFEIKKLKVNDWFYVFPFLPFFLLGSVMAVKRSKQRILVVTVLSTSIASIFVVWNNAHYMAPALVSIVGLLVHSIREIRCFRRSMTFAPNLSVILTAAIICYSLLIIAGFYLQEHPDDWGRNRAQIESTFERFDGQQLILVRYAPDSPSPDYELVFNGPDIRHQKVVWARSLDRDADSELVKSLAPRQVWTLEEHSDYETIRAWSPTK
jgi:hypothetical protein